MPSQILVGHVLPLLRDFFVANEFDCVVTSPPYWGLRDYGTEPQVWGGAADCAHDWTSIEVKRTAGGERGASSDEAIGRGPPPPHIRRSESCTRCDAWRGELGQEPTLDLHLRNLVEIFREVRRILKPSGTLWLNYGDGYATAPNGRSAAAGKATGNDDRTFRDKPFDTAKGSGLKAKDRLMLPARLALALQADGWWLRDEIVWAKKNPMPSSVKDRTTPAHEMVYLLTKRARYYFDHEAIKEPIADASRKRYAQPTILDRRGGAKQDAYRSGFIRGSSRARSRRPNEILHSLATGGAETRSRRSVWSIATKPFPEAHFATFPPALVEPCVLAGTPPGGKVLDPFFGSGTVGLVAQQHGRQCVGIELNPEYAAIARRRLGE